MSSPPDADRRPGPSTTRPRHAGPPGRPVAAHEPTDGIEATDVIDPVPEQAGPVEPAESSEQPAQDELSAQDEPPAQDEPDERPEPADPPTEPIRAGTLSNNWPESALGPMSSVPGWLIATAVVVLVGMVGLLGFVQPGFFVTPVLDQASVQDGVRMILRDNYRLPDVAAVTCPADQQVVPGRSFTCVVVVDGRRSDVPVVVQDTVGRYQVSRPAP